MVSIGSFLLDPSIQPPADQHCGNVRISAWMLRDASYAACLWSARLVHVNLVFSEVLKLLHIGLLKFTAAAFKRIENGLQLVEHKKRNACLL
ncbi:unnamed protein product [Ceratitis capitata]|uniref:(Mediterranean fruit fly) hypothetical protein n=1 Tax=Ceratitis capitata TaxID=7213 RepID=A0A811TX32_CERCA|nr:unnamed protein product [Ceratitis capitata]